MSPSNWDYLILTANNESRGSAYRHQFELRADPGLLPGARRELVVADPGGRREFDQGSVASTTPKGWLEVPRSLRILIIHTGDEFLLLFAKSKAETIS